MPAPFDVDFNDFSDPIVAPLWADYNSGSIFHRSITNSSIINHLTRMIVDINSNYSDYQPTLAVVVTWDSVLARSARVLDILLLQAVR